MQQMNARLGLSMLVAALLAGACGGTRGPETPAVSVTPEPPAAPIAEESSDTRAPGVPPAGNSTARNLAEYKVEVAQRVHQVNAGQVFAGTPPHLLRSVIVLNVVLDAGGAIKSVAVFRDNGDPETRSMAVASVRRGAPYARPARALLRGGQVQFTETWLFRDDAQFRLRTLAEAYQK